MTNLISLLFLPYLITWPALIVPLVGGLLLLAEGPDRPLARLAAWFTLKPLVALPLAFAAMAAIEGLIPTAVALAGVAALITLIIVAAHRRVFRDQPARARLLLALDAPRWLCATAYLVAEGQGLRATQLLAFRRDVMQVLFWVAMVLPSLYTVAAWVILQHAANRPAQGAGTPETAPPPPESAIRTGSADTPPCTP